MGACVLFTNTFSQVIARLCIFLSVVLRITDTFSVMGDVTVTNSLQLRFLHDPPALPAPEAFFCAEVSGVISHWATISSGSFSDNPSLTFTTVPKTDDKSTASHQPKLWLRSPRVNFL